MKKSDITAVPDYYTRYMDLVEDHDPVEVLKTALDNFQKFPLDKWELLENSTYAAGKWTVKDILQHLIDTERIFTYRALAFARKDVERIPPFNQDDYVVQAQAENRTVKELVEEWYEVRKGIITLYKSFTDQMMQNIGMTVSGEIMVLTFPYILAGHQYWHSKIIEERYLPLLSNPKMG